MGIFKYRAVRFSILALMIHCYCLHADVPGSEVLGHPISNSPCWGLLLELPAPQENSFFSMLSSLGLRTPPADRRLVHSLEPQLQRIAEHPDDDQLRIDFAVLLERESTNPKLSPQQRAEARAFADFIRNQIALANVTKDRLEIDGIRDEHLSVRQLEMLQNYFRDERELRRREETIEGRYRPQWMPKQIAGAFHYVWERGFIDEIWIYPTDFLQIAPALFRQTPTIRKLLLARDFGASASLLTEILTSRSMHQIQDLDLTWLRNTHDQLQGLMTSQTLDRLTTLRLRINNTVTRSELEHLFSQMKVPNLRTLEIGDNEFLLSDAIFTILATSPTFERLETLTILSSEMTGRHNLLDLRILATSPTSHIRHLNLLSSSYSTYFSDLKNIFREFRGLKSLRLIELEPLILPRLLEILTRNAGLAADFTLTCSIKRNIIIPPSIEIDRFRQRFGPHSLRIVQAP